MTVELWMLEEANRAVAKARAESAAEIERLRVLVQGFADNFPHVGECTHPDAECVCRVFEVREGIGRILHG